MHNQLQSVFIHSHVLQHGGITVSYELGDIPKSGYAVSPYKLREQRILVGFFNARCVSDFASKNRDLLSRPGHYFGAWVDGDLVYLDVTVVESNLAWALQIAERAGQLAIWDIKNSVEIKLAPSAPSFDLVGEIIAYESGESDAARTEALFEHLRTTGIGRQLQGHYSSRM